MKNNKYIFPILKIFNPNFNKSEIHYENIFLKVKPYPISNYKKLKLKFYERKIENNKYKYKKIGNSKIKINDNKKLIEILEFKSTLLDLESEKKDFYDIKLKCRKLMFNYLKSYTNNQNEKYYLEIDKLFENKFLRVKVRFNQKKISLENYISKIK